MSKNKASPKAGEAYTLNGYAVRVERVDYCGRVHYKTAGWSSVSYMDGKDFCRRAIPAAATVSNRQHNHAMGV